MISLHQAWLTVRNLWEFQIFKNSTHWTMRNGWLTLKCNYERLFLLFEVWLFYYPVMPESHIAARWFYWQVMQWIRIKVDVSSLHLILRELILKPLFSWSSLLSEQICCWSINQDNLSVFSYRCVYNSIQRPYHQSKRCYYNPKCPFWVKEFRLLHIKKKKKKQPLPDLLMNFCHFFFNCFSIEDLYYWILLHLFLLRFYWQTRMNFSFGFET